MKCLKTYFLDQMLLGNQDKFQANSRRHTLMNYNKNVIRESFLLRTNVLYGMDYLTS